MARMTLKTVRTDGELSDEELVDAAWLYAWSHAALRPAGSPTATRASRGPLTRAYETLRAAISYSNRLTGHRP